MTNLSTGIWGRHPELAARLIHLYRAVPMISYREIAKALSREFGLYVNRNMVVGKINRLNLEVREVVSVAPLPHEAPPAREDSAPPGPAVSPSNVTFLDLPGWGCKFPQGEPPTMRFCGQTRWGERPYCPKHYRMAYHPPTGRRA